MPHFEAPIFFIDKEEALMQLTGPAFFVTSSKAPKHFQVIAQGRLGHDEIIVFRKEK